MYEMKDTNLSAQLVEREAWVLQKAAGRSVLHLGATDAPFTRQRMNEGNLLHSKLAESASSLAGMDIAADQIQWLRTEHSITSIVEGDVERVEEYPAGDFDLVVMGEILEHLSNPGNALDAIFHATSKETALIVTVPNANSLKGTIRAGFSKELVHRDHVSYFSVSTLSELLERHGFFVESFCYYASDSGSSQAKVSAKLLKLRPALAEGLCIAARKSSFAT